MRTTYLYMNHRIHQRNPKGKVVAVKRGRRVRNVNTGVILHAGKVIGRVKFRKTPLYHVDTHRVRGWVEFYDGVMIEDGGKKGRRGAGTAP